MNEIEVPLKITGIGAIKKELRELKGEIANATDPEALASLTQRAGELKDQLADANEQVNIFASGSKFEQVSNGLGSIKDSIMSLDFAEAGQKAKLLTTSLKNLNPAEFAAQFKGFGQVIMSVGSAVGVLTSQFIKMGIALLSNPIFLLVAVIVAIVAAILIFLHKMGILKKIFEVIMIPINALIEGFKALTDWIGLTSYAAEENAAKTEEANKRVVESTDKRTQAVVGYYDYEIKMFQLYGLKTLDLELSKSKALAEGSKKKIQSAKVALDAELQLGEDADQEKIKNLRKSIEEENKIIIDERRNRNYLVAQDAVKEREDAKKKLEADKKAAEDDAKQKADAAKKAADAARKFAENRLNAARTIRDIEIALIKDDNDREVATINEKYARLIQDTKKNENLTKAEKLRLQALYNEQLKVELANQEKTVLDAEKAKQEKLLDLIKANNEARQQAEEDFFEVYRTQVMSKEQQEVDAVNAKYFQLIAKAEQYGLDTKILKEQQEKEVADITKKYADEQAKAVADAEAKKRQAQLDTANNALSIAENSTKSIQNLGDIAFAAKMAKVKKGSKEEEELAKKQFKFNKAMQLAGAIVDAGKAVTASLAASPVAIGPVPNPIGIASLATAITTSALNISKIAATQFTSTASGGGGGATTGVGAASSTSTTGTTPSFSLFGQGNDLNNVGAPQTQTNEITVNAVVSETELTNTQNKIKQINKNATL